MTTDLAARLRRLGNRWRERGASGVALTEFALMLPPMMFLLITGMELVSQALTRQQVSRLASNAADLTARYRKRIDETDINKLILGLSLSNTLPEFEDRGRIIISSVIMNVDKDGLEIAWQRCDGDLDVDSEYGDQGDGATDTSIANIDGLNVLENENLLVAEVVYDYEPIMPFFNWNLFEGVADIFSERRVVHTSAFVSRSENLPDHATKLPANAALLPDSSKALCA
jgi:TadE-like protein